VRARLAVPVAVASALCACGPAHLREVRPSGGRDLRELFLGGWDGRRLTLFDETTLEPGFTTHAQLLRQLAYLSSDAYTMVYVERAKVDAAAAAHDLFCDAAICLAVVDRRSGSRLEKWGNALAVFELAGPDGAAPLGAVWIAGAAVRPPGPRRWHLLCRSHADQPRFVHPDGGAYFPVRPGRTDGFARFGADPIVAEYRKRGTAAPSEATCDDETARMQKEEPPPVRPTFKADPTLLPRDADPSK